MAPRLKVFVTSDGLTDYAVAASSKPKALAAWGSHQDLFKTGLARETDDPELAKAALAQPGEVLRRPAGTRGELAKLKFSKAARTPAAPSKSALRKVSELEKKLQGLEASQSDEIARLEGQRAALEARIDRTRARHESERQRLREALAKARKAL